MALPVTQQLYCLDFPSVLRKNGLLTLKFAKLSKKLSLLWPEIILLALMAIKPLQQELTDHPHVSWPPSGTLGISPPIIYPIFYS